MVRWGYCGLTDDFCETVQGAPGLGCQSHCEKISTFDDVGKTGGSYGRNIIGYYSNWSAGRKCNGVPDNVLPAVRPSDLDANSYSHIVYSFASVDLNGKLLETDQNDKTMIAELQALKKKNPNLKTMWAVGGWSFNVGDLDLHQISRILIWGGLTYRTLRRRSTSPSICELQPAVLGSSRTSSASLLHMASMASTS
jgi:hypothetical protein